MDMICDMWLWELTRWLLWRTIVIIVVPTLVIYFIAND